MHIQCIICTEYRETVLSKNLPLNNIFTLVNFNINWRMLLGNKHVNCLVFGTSGLFF